ncbi:hypothetical protein PMIN03_012048 [Paraphaeosphaeria minitans]
MILLPHNLPNNTVSVCQNPETPLETPNMTSQDDWDYQLSSSKIEPLESPTKRHFPRDRTGSIGEDFDIEHSHIEPLDSPVKEHPQPMHDEKLLHDQKSKGTPSKDMENMKK